MTNKMIQAAYKDKILKEIDDLPENMLPRFYKIVHLIKTELFLYEKKKSKPRISLKGIWQGCEIDEQLFADARKSVFSYE